MVLSNRRTISNGTHIIANNYNDNYVLSVDRNQNTSGTNVLLWTKSNVAYRKFQFVYQGNGYYKIKNVGSRLYLGVANNGSKAGSNVQLSSSTTLWQVLPDAPAPIIWYRTALQPVLWIYIQEFLERERT